MDIEELKRQLLKADTYWGACRALDRLRAAGWRGGVTIQAGDPPKVTITRDMVVNRISPSITRMPVKQPEPERKPEPWEPPGLYQG